MDANLKKLSEYFGPGCRVLDVRFACIESGNDENPPYADCSTKPSCAAVSLSMRRELVVSACAASPRWNHPVPGRAIHSQFSRHPRRRKKFGVARRKPLGRTPLLLAAAGVAMTMLLALVYPNTRFRAESVFSENTLSVCLNRFLSNSENDLLKVDESIARDYRRSLVDWQEKYATTMPCYATVNMTYSQ